MTDNKQCENTQRMCFERKYKMTMKRRSTGTAQATAGAILKSKITQGA